MNPAASDGSARRCASTRAARPTPGSSAATSSTSVARASSWPSGSRAEPGPQKRIAATAIPCAQADEAVDRHVLVDHVRDADAVAVEARRPVGDRRDAGELRQRRAVVPRVEAADAARVADIGASRRASVATIGSEVGISNGITAFGHHSICGGWARSQSSAARLTSDPRSTSARTSGSPAALVGLRREVHDGDRQLARWPGR